MKTHFTLGSQTPQSWQQLGTKERLLPLTHIRPNMCNNSFVPYYISQSAQKIFPLTDCHQAADL